MTSSLRITEMFVSLQGESTLSGLRTVFVRLTGCPLRCRYCDSEYAFHGGQRMDLEMILDTVAGYGAPCVCVTGGEPLAQPESRELLRRLCAAGYTVSLETSGAMDIAGIDPGVHRIVDIKTPDSGECERNLLENLPLLTSRDQVKFVLCSRADYDWALDFIQQHSLHNGPAELLFSPSWDQLSATDLADWIVADGAPVRYQIQLHKILWGDRPGV